MKKFANSRYQKTALNNKNQDSKQSTASKNKKLPIETLIEASRWALVRKKA